MELKSNSVSKVEEIPAITSRLAILVTSTMDYLSVLEGRLHPILSQEKSDGNDRVPSQTSSCPLGEFLDEQNNQLELAIAKIQSITQRLRL